jgi:hypothetical protein
MSETVEITTKTIAKKRRGKHYRDAEIISALQASNGLIYQAASRLGCAPTTIYDRAASVKAVQQAIDDARGNVLDLAETALMSAVSRGEAWAVCFLLKTLGKSRGYVERAAPVDIESRIEIDLAPLGYRDAVSPLLVVDEK